jgi:hypothetical protein
MDTHSQSARGRVNGEYALQGMLQGMSIYGHRIATESRWDIHRLRVCMLVSLTLENPHQTSVRQTVTEFSGINSFSNSLQ